MEGKLNIPQYLSVKQWRHFNSLEHLTDSEKMITMISLLSEHTEDEVRSWELPAIKGTYSKVLDVLSDIEPQFYPVFELDGVLYGYSSMQKMTLGEYVDLERLAKNPSENIEEIMAILYRPITKHKFGGIKWAFRNTFKVTLGKAENLFKYYELEKYDSSERVANAEKLSVLPASICLGALSFFLVLVSSSLISSSLSSLPQDQQMTSLKEMNKEMTSISIGDGLRQFITSLQHPSFQSQAINQFQS